MNIERRIGASQLTVLTSPIFFFVPRWLRVYFWVNIVTLYERRRGSTSRGSKRDSTNHGDNSDVKYALGAVLVYESLVESVQARQKTSSENLWSIANSRVFPHIIGWLIFKTIPGPENSKVYPVRIGLLNEFQSIENKPHCPRIIRFKSPTNALIHTSFAFYPNLLLFFGNSKRNPLHNATWLSVTALIEW